MDKTKELNVIFRDYNEEVQSLNDLVVQGDCMFLIGAGCSKVADLPLMSELTVKVLQDPKLGKKSKKILEHVLAQFPKAPTVNIEDYLSEIVDYLSIVTRRKNKGIDAPELSLNGQTLNMNELTEVLENIKVIIANTIKEAQKEANITVHRRFVKAVHRISRPGLLSKEKIITYLNLNYDTLLEDALAIEKIPFYDGIDGGASGWWNFEKYNNDDIGSKVLKLHGSIDWSQVEGDHLPRRFAYGRLEKEGRSNVMIWPASTKFRETQLDPFAQLLDLARKSLKSDGRSEKVLIVMGYSFADTHINYELDKALRDSEDSLTIVVFTSDNEPEGKLKTWHEDESINKQIRIYANKGFFHGGNAKSSTEELLWWKFENIVKLIRGEEW